MNPPAFDKVAHDRFVDQVTRYFVRLPSLYVLPGFLESLSEYSCSIPTGVTPGKQWKCDLFGYAHAMGWPRPHCWVIQEYGPAYQDHSLPPDRNGKPQEFCKIISYRPQMLRTMPTSLEAGLHRLLRGP